MYTLLTIACYFGKLPEHFPIFMRSIEMNPTIDFLLITDCTVRNPPANLKVYNCSFEDLRKWIQALFDFEIVLDRPYKLCDYKPVWGLAIKEYIEGYDFWGYCDLDMIFGDIRSFLPDSILEEYDKIYKLGHLTYYRNTDVNNTRFKLANWLTYKDAFTTEEITAFDEIAGMQNIYDMHGFPTYFSRDYADITYGKVKFTLSYFHVPEELVEVNNFKEQVFYWKDGKVFRAYVKGEQIYHEEFNYIHFSKRKMYLNDVDEKCEAFFITNNGLRRMPPTIDRTCIIDNNKSKVLDEIYRTIQCRIRNYINKLSDLYKCVYKKKVMGNANQENTDCYIKNDHGRC